MDAVTLMKYWLCGLEIARQVVTCKTFSSFRLEYYIGNYPPLSEIFVG